MRFNSFINILGKSTICIMLQEYKELTNILNKYLEILKP